MVFRAFRRAQRAAQHHGLAHGRWLLTAYGIVRYGVYRPFLPNSCNRRIQAVRYPRTVGQPITAPPAHPNLPEPHRCFLSSAARLRLLLRFISPSRRLRLIHLAPFPLLFVCQHSPLCRPARVLPVTVPTSSVCLEGVRGFHPLRWVRRQDTAPQAPWTAAVTVTVNRSIIETKN